jgi:transglutaminase-like putative cysteine protease
MIEYLVRHETEYEYGYEVVHSHQLLHLRPRALSHQRCVAHTLDIEPSVSVQMDGFDAFDNPVTRLEIDRPHQSLRVVSEISIATTVRERPANEETLGWEAVRAKLRYAARPPDNDIFGASRYRHESPYVRIKQVFEEYAGDCFPENRPILECALALTKKLHEEMTYSPGATQIATPLLDVLQRKRGVCQDYAHLMLACLRSRGLAARYVSGYLRTMPRDGAPRLVGSDASHAWVSVFCPPLGWVDLDPTNGVRVDHDHIVLAWGRDFGDVSPLRGVIVGGGQHTVKVSVVVTTKNPTDFPTR